MPFKVERELTQQLRSCLTGTENGFNPVWFRDVTSTNDILWDLINSGEPEKTVVLAEYQSKGRGKYGAKWVSPSGEGVLLSAAFREPAEYRVLMTGTGALAVQDVCREYGVETSAKWPNDILAGGRKLCGILAESKNIESTDWIVLGIGCNVNNLSETLPEDFASITTSLRIACGCEEAIDRPEFAAKLIRRLDYWFSVLEEERYNEIAEAWYRALDISGRTVLLKERSGERGVLKGLNPDGSFRVELSGATAEADYDKMIILTEG